MARIKKPQPRTVGVLLLVEVAGVEPASEGPASPDLHAYPNVGSRPPTARWAKHTGGPACFELAEDRRAAGFSDSVMMTLPPRARTQVVSGLGLKRPERRRRRSRLEFCRWINEESCPLGMHRTNSQPPSKPEHPRENRSGPVWGLWPGQGKGGGGFPGAGVGGDSAAVPQRVARVKADSPIDFERESDPSLRSG